MKDSDTIPEELKLSPVAMRSLVLADGRRFEAPLVVVYVRAFDHESIALAAVTDSPDPLTWNIHDGGSRHRDRPDDK